MNLNLDSPSSIKNQEVWTSLINKETPIIAATFFYYRSKRGTRKYYGLEMINHEVNQRADLHCMEEEADSRLVLYVANVREECFKNCLALSNDSDAVTYLSAYFD